MPDEATHCGGVSKSLITLVHAAVSMQKTHETPHHIQVLYVGSIKT